jgi:DNA-binding NarL/FixJ family response regulator
MRSEIRVVVADDHPVFRQGLQQIIEIESEIQIVGQAGDGVAALQLIHRRIQDQQRDCRAVVYQLSHGRESPDEHLPETRDSRQQRAD